MRKSRLWRRVERVSRKRSASARVLGIEHLRQAAPLRSQPHPVAESLDPVVVHGDGGVQRGGQGETARREISPTTTRCTTKPAAARGRITIRTKNSVRRRCRDIRPLLNGRGNHFTGRIAIRGGCPTMCEGVRGFPHADLRVRLHGLRRADRGEAELRRPAAGACARSAGASSGSSTPPWAIVFKGSGFYSTDSKKKGSSSVGVRVVGSSRRTRRASPRARARPRLERLEVIVQQLAAISKLVEDSSKE